MRYTRCRESAPNDEAKGAPWDEWEGSTRSPGRWLAWPLRLSGRLDGEEEELLGGWDNSHHPRT